MGRTSAIIFAMAMLTAGVTAQEPAAPAAQPPKPVVSQAARLQAAKTVFVKRVDGGSVASETITNILEGWGRYKLVNAAAEADLIVEVTSPDDSGGVSVSSSTSGPSRTGDRYEQSSKSSREISSGSGPLRMAVRDSKTNITLWSGSEQIKGALKRNARENNAVEAAQKLVAKFRDRVERANELGSTE
jgi:hypothetical protein